MTAAFDLNLRHLGALSTVVEHGSVSAAASRVALSQPALTEGINKLEKKLGTLLFERRSSGLTSTAEGRLMAERADAAFAHLATAASGLRGARAGFGRPERLVTSTQLDAFLQVAQAGGYSGAAQGGAASQPALHRAVRDLEQIIGLPLVERRGRGIALTAAGRRIARGARLAEREIAAGIAELSADPAGSGTVVVGAMPLVRALVLPRALAVLTREQPGVRVEVVEGSWRELVEPLRDGQLDLMLGALREQSPAGLDQQPLFTDRLAVIARAGHPLMGVAAPTLGQLTSYPWIVGSGDTPLASQFARLFGDDRPPAPIACGSVMVIRGMLRDTDLLTLLSPDQVALEIDAGMLTAIGPALADSVRTIGVTTRSGWRRTSAQGRLVTLLQEAANRSPEKR